jgi:hypothetical protein
MRAVLLLAQRRSSFLGGENALQQGRLLLLLLRFSLLEWIYLLHLVWDLLLGKGVHPLLLRPLCLLLLLLLLLLPMLLLLPLLLLLLLHGVQ